MSEKVKYREADKPEKKIKKRLVNVYKNRHRNMRTGTVPKAAVRYVVSSEEIEELRKRHYQIRVIGRLNGIQDVQNAVKERDVEIVIEAERRILRVLNKMRADSRQKSRNDGDDGGGGGGGGTPPNRIFHRLIDENKMADCIRRIKDGFFNNEKECEICKKKCTIYDFFMLVQLYFNYIGIMEKNVSQAAFCKYLNSKVFGGNDIVNVRSFNNYPKKDAYVNFEKLLSNNKNIKFDNHPQPTQSGAESSLLPKTVNFLLAPFQEIGRKFHNSRFFSELRDEQKKVQSFVL